MSCASRRRTARGRISKARGAARIRRPHARQKDVRKADCAALYDGLRCAFPAKRGAFCRSAADSGAVRTGAAGKPHGHRGPTTLAALISSLQLGFKSLAIEQRTQEVMNLLGAIRTDFAGFASRSGARRKAQAGDGGAGSCAAAYADHRQAFSDVNGLPESEAKKLLGLTDDDEEDEWD